MSQRAGDSFISFLMQVGVSRPEIISLAAGLVDQATLPVACVRDAFESVFADPVAARRALQYGTTEGDLRLRELVAEHLGSLELNGRSLDQNRLVETTGSQQVLQLVAEILIDPGDIVVVGTPDYFVFMDVMRAAGARLEGVDMDEEGMVPESLQERLEHIEGRGELDRVKLVYCTTFHQNPTGVTLAEHRRVKILDVVRSWSYKSHIYVLEDAAYRELTYFGEPGSSIWSHDESGGTVILTQTFSKTFSPGLKTGFVVLPDELRRPFVQMKGNHDFGSCNFAQQLLAQVLDGGGYSEHVADLCGLYRGKMEVMADALEETFGARAGSDARWTNPRGGLYIWLTLPGIDTRRDGPLFGRCMEEGVIYVPGVYCFAPGCGRPTDPLGGPHNTMRLSFGVQSPRDIQRGIQRLGAAVSHCARRPRKDVELTPEPA